MPINAKNYLPIRCSRLIVCEKSGGWANALRRSLDDGGRWIVEARSLGQLAAALSEHPASLCLVECTSDNVVRAAACIDELHHQQRHAHLIAACREASPSAEPILREVGAAHVVHSRRDIDIVKRLWLNHCRIHPPLEPSLREQLFASLPWDEL